MHTRSGFSRIHRQTLRRLCRTSLCPLRTPIMLIPRSRLQRNLAHVHCTTLKQCTSHARTVTSKVMYLDAARSYPTHLVVPLQPVHDQAPAATGAVADLFQTFALLSRVAALESVNAAEEANATCIGQAFGGVQSLPAANASKARPFRSALQLCP